MKCSNCGREIQIGEAFCHFCGKETRIVPDYNVLEDDLHVLLNETKKPEQNIITNPIVNENKDHNISKKPEKNYKKIIIILCSIVTVIFLMIMIYAFVSTSKKGKSFDFQYKNAVEYMDEGIYTKARDSLEQALSIDPENEKAMLKMAELYMLEKKQSKAINQYLDIIDLYPTQKDAYEELLAIYESENDQAAILKLVRSTKNKDILKIFKNYIVAAPEFEVKPGTYNQEMEITLSAPINARIFYTVDGVVPTENNDLYSASIPLTEGIHIVQAIAMNDYNIYSEPIEGKFEIILEAPDAPKASIESGTYNLDQLITISVPEGCVAYYTWDGTNPTANSFRYSSAIEMLVGNNILSIISIDEHKKSSEVVRYNYIFNKVED